MDFRGFSDDVKRGFGSPYWSDTTYDKGNKRKRSRSPSCTGPDQGVKRLRWSDQAWDPCVLPVTPGENDDLVIRVGKRKRDQEDVEHVELQQKRAKSHHCVESEGKVSSSPPVIKISTSGDQIGESDETQPSAHTSDWHVMEGRPYLKGPLLGEGGFGSVYAGICVYDGVKVAIKYVPKENAEMVQHDELGLVPMEVALMKVVNSDASCPNILQLLDWFEEADHYIMILERPAPCKDLFSFLDESNTVLQEDQAKKVMLQLINALKHCESRGVLHRDVKLDNILIRTDTNEIKLLDFGCGDFLKDSAYRVFKGTYMYAPPELYIYGRYHARPMTVWSVGVTLYTMLSQDMPFYTQTDIVKNDPAIPLHLSPECEDLLRWCLSTDPENRPSLKDIEHHPWFN